MADKLGRDAAEFRRVEESGRVFREPVMGEAHKRGMIVDLYRVGWSYRLIAQLADMPAEEVRQILGVPVAE